MRRAIIGILALGLLLSSLPAAAHDSEPPQDALRDIEPETTSRGFVFETTITFTVPHSDEVFVDEGNGGRDWFIPEAQGGFLLFQIVEFQGSPPPTRFNGRGLWVWEEEAFVPGDLVRLTYAVLVDGAVDYGVYRVLGSVGDDLDENGHDEERATIRGDLIVEVRPPTVVAATNKASYAPGEQVALRAEVRYPDGSAGTGGTVIAHVQGTGPIVLTELPRQKGVYAGVLTLRPDETPGPKTVRVIFEDQKGNVASDLLTFEVIVAPPTTLNVVVTPAKPAFRVDEVIVIRATASLPGRGPVSGATLVASFNRTAGAFPMAEVGLGLYEVRIGPVNLPGLWEVRVIGSFGNARGEGVATFGVLPAPPGILDIIVTPLKPAFQADEEIVIRATASLRGGGLVSGATLVATFNRTAGAFLMAEVGLGLYEVSIGPVNLPGLWAVRVSGSFGNAVGEGFATFTVLSVPAVTLDILVTPLKPVFQVGEEVVIRAAASLPGLGPVSGATLVATFNRSADVLPMTEIALGLYEVVFGPLNLTGLWEVRVTGSVAGAAGQSSATFEIVEAPPPGFALFARSSRDAFARLETVTLLAETTLNGVPFPVSSVTARVVGLSQILDFVSVALGRYQVSFVLPEDFPLGVAAVGVVAVSNVGNASTSIRFSALPTPLLLELQFDRPVYEISETVLLSVSVRYVDARPAESAGTLLVSPPGSSVNLSRVGAGRLSASFGVPPGSIQGIWRVTIMVRDLHGNEGSAAASVSVVPATFSVSLSAEPTSSPRLSEVRLRAEARYPAGDPVVNARVAVTLSGRQLGQVILRAQGGGVYEETLPVGRDFPLGETPLTVHVDHPDGRGQGASSMMVTPTPLDVEANLARPSIVPGETVGVRALVTYVNGEALREGVIQARIRDPLGATVEILILVFDQGSIAFVGQWESASAAAPGTYTLELEVEDRFGNRGVGSITLLVTGAFVPPDLRLDVLLLAGLLILAAIFVAALITYVIREGGRRDAARSS